MTRWERVWILFYANFISGDKKDDLIRSYMIFLCDVNGSKQLNILSITNFCEKEPSSCLVFVYFCTC